MEASPPKTKQIGTHILQEEDDLLLVRWIGTPTLDEQHRIYDQIDEWLKARGSALLLFDLREAGPLRAEHRKASADWWRQRPLESIALAQYGVSPAIRVVLMLLLTAVRLMAKKTPQIEFFATEAESRAWLQSMKPRLPPFS